MSSYESEVEEGCSSSISLETSNQFINSITKHQKKKKESYSYSSSSSVNFYHQEYASLLEESSGKFQIMSSKSQECDGESCVGEESSFPASAMNDPALQILKKRKRKKDIIDRGKTVYFKVRMMGNNSSKNFGELVSILKKYAKWFVIFQQVLGENDFFKSTPPPKSSTPNKKPKKKKLFMEDTSSEEEEEKEKRLGPSNHNQSQDEIINPATAEVFLEGMANSGKNSARWTSLIQFISDMKSGGGKFKILSGSGSSSSSSVNTKSQTLVFWTELKRKESNNTLKRINEWGKEPLFHQKDRNRQTEKKMTIQMLSKIPIERICVDNPDLSPWQFNQAYKAAETLQALKAKQRKNSQFKFAHKIFEWQKQLIKILQNAVTDEEDRKIIFLVDPIGGNGKTNFLSWLGSLPMKSRQIENTFERELSSLDPNLWKACQQQTQQHQRPSNKMRPLLSEGMFQFLTLDTKRSDDIFYLIEPDANKFFIDVARDEAKSLSYPVLEKLKSGVWNCNKYEGKRASYQNGQVIVAINEFPNLSKLSRDRYEVYLIHPSEKCLIFIPWENIPQPNDPFFATLTQQTVINEGKSFQKFLEKIFRNKPPPSLSVFGVGGLNQFSAIANKGGICPPPSSDIISSQISPPHVLVSKEGGGSLSMAKEKAKQNLLNSFIAPSLCDAVEEEKDSSSSIDLDRLDFYFAQDFEEQHGPNSRIESEDEDRLSTNPFASPDFDKMSNTPLINTF